MKRKSLLVFPILLVASLASCSSGSSKGESAKKNNALMHPENLSVEVVDEFEIKTPKEFDYDKFYPRYMQAATSFGEDYNSITIGEIESMSSNNSKLQVMNYISEYTFAKNYFSGTSRRVIELDELKFVAEDSGDIYAHKDGHTYGKEIYGGEEYYYIDEEDDGDFLAHYKEQQTSLAMESHAMLSQFVEYAFYFYSQLYDSKFEFGQISGGQYALKVTANDIATGSPYNYEGKTYYSHTYDRLSVIIVFEDKGDTYKIQSALLSEEVSVDSLQGRPLETPIRTSYYMDYIIGKNVSDNLASDFIKSMPKSFSYLDAKVVFYDILRDEGGEIIDFVIDKEEYMDTIRVGDKKFIYLPEIAADSNFDIQYSVALYELKDNQYVEKETTTSYLSTPIDLPFHMELEQEVYEQSVDNVLVCFSNIGFTIPEMMFEYTCEKKDNYVLKLFNPVVGIYY